MVPPQTHRTRMRQLSASDAPALRRVLGDPVAMHAYEHSFAYDETEQWIERQRERYAQDGFGLWALVLRETGEVIGDAGITWQLLDGDTVLEVGYHLERRFQGRGLATEAARACVDAAFVQLHADAVWAKVRDTNLASMNVAIRIGMRVRRRFTVRYRDVDMPHLGFAITRAEWGASAESTGATGVGVS